MNSGHDQVGHDRPVHVGIDAELVPGTTLEPSAVAWEGHEAEFAAPGAEVSVEMRWGQVFIQTRFTHRRRLRGHVKRQSLAGLPVRDRFDECAGRKLAVASRANARAVDARALGV